MAEHRIQVHESIWSEDNPFEQMLARMWTNNRIKGRIPAAGGPLPPTSKVKGTREARISWGRWLVDCPTCNSAMVVSDHQARFICVECGSPENDYHWYEASYPAEWKEIEEVLLERPDPPPGQHWAKARNWNPGETVDRLRLENRLGRDLTRREVRDGLD